jgi:hypothetical protein
MHPLSCVWIANLDQSRRDPNHQFHRAMMRFEVVGSTISLTYGGVNASGREERGGQTLHADGNEHAVPEAPGVVAVTTLGPLMVRAVAKKDGAVIGCATYEASEDGQTMTATVSGLDATGHPFTQVIVFDRDNHSDATPGAPAASD